VQRERVFANDSFLVAQITSSQRPFVTGNWVSFADSHDLEDRPFAAVVRDAEAVTQITASFSLTRRAPVQRNLIVAAPT
jgi:hypothetical protein